MQYKENEQRIQYNADGSQQWKKEEEFCKALLPESSLGDGRNHHEMDVYHVTVPHERPVKVVTAASEILPRDTERNT